MKPTRAQCFFARSRLLQVVFVLLLFVAPLCFAYFVAGLLARVYTPLSDIWNLARLVFFVTVGLLLSFLMALVAASFLAGIIWPLLRPLYQARCRKNGAPFRVGDCVQILVGRYRGRVVRIYNGWRDESVRVELGEREKETFKDIFDPIQLLREDVDLSLHPTAARPLSCQSHRKLSRPIRCGRLLRAAVAERFVRSRMNLIGKLFRKRDQTEPGRLYVIIGVPHRTFEEPAYVTDPRHYGLPLFKAPVSDEEFDRDYRHKVKAFIKRDDANKFAYHCNLEGVICPVYDRMNDKWIYNSEETGKVADDIN